MLIVPINSASFLGLDSKTSDLKVLGCARRTYDADNAA